jgi:xanthine dehydrogenase accessory factor
MGWEVGLACGGEIDVLVEVLDPALCAALREGCGRDQPCALATVVEPEQARGQKALLAAEGSLLYAADLSPSPGIVQAVQSAVERGQAEAVSLSDPKVELFIEPFLPPPTLVVIGGVHVAVPLVRFAKELGFRVILADPRAHFAKPERFPQADQVLVEWPDEALAHLSLDPNTYVVILTHDPKIDEPALSSLLGSSGEAARIAYVGAIGSRQTHATRFERLDRLGVNAERLEQVYAPIGLDLGGQTPAEIALSIMAEIVAVKNGRSGGSLRGGSGPIGV